MNPGFFNEVQKLISLNLLDALIDALVAGFSFTTPFKLYLKVSWLAYLLFNVFISSEVYAESFCNRTANLIFIRESLGGGLKMYFLVPEISKWEQEVGGGLEVPFSHDKNTCNSKNPIKCVSQGNGSMIRRLSTRGWNKQMWRVKKGKVKVEESRTSWSSCKEDKGTCTSCSTACKSESSGCRK